MDFPVSGKIISITAAAFFAASVCVAVQILGGTEENNSEYNNTELKEFKPAAIPDSYLEKGDYIKIIGDGITVEDNLIRITAGGAYNISGDFENFGIDIDTAENVELKLKGLNMKSKGRPAIFTDNGGTVTITAVEHTRNFLSDDETSKKPLIFSKGNLFFDGNGELGMESRAENAVYCNGGVSVLGGVYRIRPTLETAIYAEGGFSVDGGSVAITESKEGIRSPSVSVNNGSLLIQTDSFAFKATNRIDVNGGALIVLSDEFSDNAGNVNLKDGRLFSLTGEALPKGGKRIRHRKDNRKFDDYITAGSQFAIKNENGDILEQFTAPRGFYSFEFASPLLDNGTKYYVTRDNEVVNVLSLH